MSVVAIFTVAKIWKQCKSPWASQAALVAKNPPGEAGGVRDVGSVPGSGSSPGGGNGNHASILAGESQGQRSLVGYNPWNHRVGHN